MQNTAQNIKEHSEEHVFWELMESEWNILIYSLKTNYLLSAFFFIYIVSHTL